MKTVLLFCFFISVELMFSQNDFYFKRTNIATDEFPSNLLQLKNSNTILLLCLYKNPNTGISNPIIFKISNSHIIDSLYIDSLQGSFHNLIQVAPNKIAVFGLTENYIIQKEVSTSLSLTNYSLSFWTIDTSLHILSYKEYETNFVSPFYLFITRTSKNDFAISVTGNFPSGNSGILYAMLDSAGNMKDTARYLNTSGSGFGYNILEQGKDTFLSFVHYSGYIIYGTTACIVKQDSLLRTISVDTIPPIQCGIYSIMSAVSKNNHEFYLSGEYHSHIGNTGYFRVGISLFDSAFHVEKTVLLGNLVDTINFPSLEKSIDFVNYNNIFVAYTYNFDMSGSKWSSYKSWIAAVNLDSNLNIRWRKYIGGDLYYTSSSVRATPDGGCLITGPLYDSTLNVHQRDIFIIKLDSAGNVVSSIPNNLQIIDKALIYPNPGQNELNITLPESHTETMFELYNATGAMCKQSIFNTEHQTLNTSDLLQGIYLYRIMQDGKVISSGKWVKD